MKKQMHLVRSFSNGLLLVAGIWFGLPRQGLGQVIIDEIASGGSGCKLESLYGSVDDQGAVIYFNEFYLEGQDQRTIQRTQCSLAIPVRVPSGKKLVFEKMNLSGVNYLADGIKSTVSFEGFFASGESGDREVREREKSGFEAFSLGDKLKLKTQCGEDTILRVSASAIMKGQSERYSLIFLSRLKLKFYLEDC